MSMSVAHAILHVFDLEGGATSLSSLELDLSERPVKSYVQRTLRKLVSSPENKHGSFLPQSSFAPELTAYFDGKRDFVGFSTQIAEFLYEELRRGEDVGACDLLVADFEDDSDVAAVEAPDADDETAEAAFEGRGERKLALALLPRKQVFAHDVRHYEGSPANGIVRHDAVLPSPASRLESYAVIEARTLNIDFNDKARVIAGSETMVVPDSLLQCSSNASSKEVLDAVTRIVADVAEEYGANTAKAVSKAKAVVAEKAAESEYLPPWEVGEEVFGDEPVMRERFEEAVRSEEIPEQVRVKKSVATRMTKSHRIRTDTGIEITFPSEYSSSPEFIEFINEADGTLSIELKNIGSIENR